MSWVTTYKSQVMGTQRIPEQSFRRHILRYWITAMVLLLGALGGGMYWLMQHLSAEQLQTMAQQGLDGIESLYPPALEVTYDPLVGISTNATGPVVWSTEQVGGAFAFLGSGSHDEMSSEFPKNILVLDLSGTVESLTSYDTLMLLTQTYMYARSSNEIKIYPLISPEAQQEIQTPIRLTKDEIAKYIASGKEWVRTDGATLHTTIGSWVGIIGLFLIPLAALFMTAWVSLGMVLVSLIGWLVSKIWVRCSWTYLFTGLSLFYLPWYIISKILVWTGVVSSVGMIGYLVMVACLAVLIVREEEDKK